MTNKTLKSINRKQRSLLRSAIECKRKQLSPSIFVDFDMMSDLINECNFIPQWFTETDQGFRITGFGLVKFFQLHS